MKKRALAFVGVVFAILAVLLIWWFNRDRQALVLDALPHRASNIPLYTSGQQPPPTNKWFSSLAFASPSEPVFAYPLAFKTIAKGLGVSHPDITSSSDLIAAPFRQDIGLQFDSQVESRVSSYDDLSVTLEFRADGRKVADARLTQGSPYLFMNIEPHTGLAVSANLITQSENDYTFTSNGHQYGIFSEALFSSNRFSTNSQPAEFALYILPGQAAAEPFRRAARNAIVRTEVQHKITSSAAETTFIVETKHQKPTPFALLPTQQPQVAVSKFKTLLGEQTVNELQQHTFTTPLLDMPGQLPLERLSETQRQILQTTLQSEVKTVSFSKNDSYFSGKEFYKVASMLQLAHQLGLHTEAKALQTGLKVGLQKWLAAGKTATEDGSYFYYDTALKGVVGVPSAFGSEEFNDHHFHFGYFIYAAAILAQHDPAFLSEHKAMVNTLVADIACLKRDDQRLPYLRVFDQYAGHSWASGLAPFADGNNQESSSEAANAWYAATLWAKVSGNSEMETVARWLYAREVQAAQRYYVAFGKNRPELKNYEHSIISILWGGKADYATFFSPKPEAKLAIQLLPLNPAASYVAADKQRAMQNYQAMLTEGGGQPTMFKDYLTMYQAMFDKPAALKNADALTSQDLDGANSRSYMQAWVYTR